MHNPVHVLKQLCPLWTLSTDVELHRRVTKKTKGNTIHYSFINARPVLYTKLYNSGIFMMMPVKKY